MEPVIIIGAPRSGTNMLRDWLASSSNVATWPCDEINYIWRHQHVMFPSDAFTAEMATPSVQRYIRRKFQWVEKRYGVTTILEKTCANSLRVPFVERALGGPRYIFIYRNGVDAVASAMKRWKAELDLLYLLKKARFVPFSDLPYYGLRYAGTRLYRICSREKRLSSWGPVLPDMASLLKQCDLAEICALQWRACVECSLGAFDAIPPERVFRLAYEEVVQSKARHARELADFVGIVAEELEGSRYLESISTRSVGKGVTQLGSATLSKVRDIIDPAMRELGYQ